MNNLILKQRKKQELSVVKDEVLVEDKITTEYSGMFKGLSSDELNNLSKQVSIPKNDDKSIINTDLTKKDKEELNKTYAKNLDGASVFNRKIDFVSENKKCESLLDSLMIGLEE